MDTRERRERAAAEAAEWLVRLQATDMSRSERTEFVEWLRESQLHVSEMLRISHVHSLLSDFGNWGELQPVPIEELRNTAICDEAIVQLPTEHLRRERDEPGGERPRTGSECQTRPEEWRRKNFPLGLWSVRGRTTCAAVAVSACALFFGLAWMSGAFGSTIIKTDRAERRQVVLTDGSVIDVSPETIVRIEFNDTERRVVLERGDALFKVAKNRHRPFIVDADRTLVRAVGTAFGVERQDDSSVIVTVSEGRVAVTRTEEGARTRTIRRALRSVIPDPLPLGEGQREVTLEEIPLTAGQQLDIPHIGEIGPARAVDSHRELAWAEGRLVFENEDVAHIIEQFNRYNRIQLRVTDTALANRLVSGVFNAADPESFISFIQTVAHVRVIRGDDQEITLAPQ